MNPISETLADPLSQSVSESMSESLNDSTEPLNKRRRVRPKTFQWDWLKIPEFKPWLQPVPNDDTKFFCTACNNSYNGGKSEISKHFNTRMHIEKCAKTPMSPVVQEKVKPPPPPPIIVPKEKLIPPVTKTVKELNFHSRVQNAEIRLAAFFAEHNISIQIAQFLLTLMKSILPDSEIVKKMTLGRNKCTKIMTNVLGRCEKEKIIDNIRVDKFSIFVNESIDMSNNKWMTFLVKYIDTESLQTRCELLELIKIKNKDTVDVTLLSSFEDILQQKLIPSDNLVGFACSNFSQMVDHIGSLLNRLRTINPNLFIMDCICNSASIAASSAVAKLPHDCEEICRLIASYLKSCGKKVSTFYEFQQSCENKYRGAKSMHNRWFLFYDCIVKLLACWDALETFLSGEINSNKNKGVENLLTTMRSVEVIATFLFLKHQIAFFKHFNDIFQKKSTVVHKVHSEVNALLRKIGSTYLKSYVITHMAEVNNIDFASPTNQVSLDEIQLGAECSTYLQRKMESGDFDVKRMTEFRKSCLDFLITACDEISTRLPLSDPILSRLHIFEPSFALNDSHRASSFIHLQYLAKEFSVCEDEKSLEQEWNTLYHSIDPELKTSLAKMDFDNMWIEISNVRDKDMQYVFPQLKRLVNVVRILPHSTVEAEGNFALLASAKSKKRNLMDGSTLNAICLIKSSLKARGETSTTMNIDTRHFELMNSDNLYGLKQSKKDKTKTEDTSM